MFFYTTLKIPTEPVITHHYNIDDEHAWVINMRQACRQSGRQSSMRSNEMLHLSSMLLILTDASVAVKNWAMVIEKHTAKWFHSVECKHRLSPLSNTKLFFFSLLVFEFCPQRNESTISAAHHMWMVCSSCHGKHLRN